MKIQDYINEKNRNQKNKKTSYTASKNQDYVNPEDAMNKYSKMSEEELMGELFRVGSCSSGGTTPEQLDSFFSNVQGMLSEEQKEKMKRLITQLKMN